MDGRWIEVESGCERHGLKERTRWWCGGDDDLLSLCPPPQPPRCNVAPVTGDCRGKTTHQWGPVEHLARWAYRNRRLCLLFTHMQLYSKVASQRDRPRPPHHAYGSLLWTEPKSASRVKLTRRAWPHPPPRSLQGGHEMAATVVPPTVLRPQPPHTPSSVAVAVAESGMVSPHWHVLAGGNPLEPSLPSVPRSATKQSVEPLWPARGEISTKREIT